MEWTPGTTIRQIIVYGPAGQYGESEGYQVGYGAGGGAVVTEIRPIVKGGGFSDIAYVQVWCGESLYAEFSQHHLQGVYYDPDFEEVDP